MPWFRAAFTKEGYFPGFSLTTVVYRRLAPTRFKGEDPIFSR